MKFGACRNLSAQHLAPNPYRSLFWGCLSLTSQIWGVPKPYRSIFLGLSKTYAGENWGPAQPYSVILKNPRASLVFLLHFLCFVVRFCHNGKTVRGDRRKSLQLQELPGCAFWTQRKISSKWNLSPQTIARHSTTTSKKKILLNNGTDNNQYLDTFFFCNNGETLGVLGKTVTTLWLQTTCAAKHQNNVAAFFLGFFWVKSLVRLAGHILVTLGDLGHGPQDRTVKVQSLNRRRWKLKPGVFKVLKSIGPAQSLFWTRLKRPQKDSWRRVGRRFLFPSPTLFDGSVERLFLVQRLLQWSARTKSTLSPNTSKCHNPVQVWEGANLSPIQLCAKTKTCGCFLAFRYIQGNQVPLLFFCCISSIAWFFFFCPFCLILHTLRIFAQLTLAEGLLIQVRFSGTVWARRVKFGVSLSHTG